MPEVEERVDRLEHLMAQFVTNVGIEFNKLYNAQMRTEFELREFKEEMRLYRENSEREMNVFKDEMRDFKDGMITFKDEMRDFKDGMITFKGEMRDFKDGMITFKDEMRNFKDGMITFKDENRLQIREMNIKWGEMARKLGTIAEDLVAPSLPRIIKEEFNLETVFLGLRMKKKLIDGRVKEYDAVAAAGDYVFVNSTKSTLKSDDVVGLTEDIQLFREFFPEYKRCKIIGILASLYVDQSIVKYAEKSGFLLLAVGDALMETKNSKGFKPKEW